MATKKTGEETNGTTAYTVYLAGREDAVKLSADQMKMEPVWITFTVGEAEIAQFATAAVQAIVFDAPR